MCSVIASISMVIASVAMAYGTVPTVGRTLGSGNRGEARHWSSGASAETSPFELDPERETRRYLDQVKATIRPLVSGERSATVFRQLDLARHAPGTEEAALFDALVGLLLETGREYDRLIFDTAPGGHTVRLLALPEIMGAWVDGLMQRRRKVRSDYQAWLGDGEVVDDPIQEALMRRRGRLAAAREHLTCAARSAVVLVANPERLPTLETARTRELLEAHGLHVGALAINKCLPAHVDSDWLANWRDEQRPWLEQLRTTFADRPVRRIEHQSRAPASCDDLQPLVEALSDLSPWRAHDAHQGAYASYGR